MNSRRLVVGEEVLIRREVGRYSSSCNPQILILHAATSQLTETPPKAGFSLSAVDSIRRGRGLEVGLWEKRGPGGQSVPEGPLLSEALNLTWHIGLTKASKLQDPVTLSRSTGSLVFSPVHLSGSPAGQPKAFRLEPEISVGALASLLGGASRGRNGMAKTFTRHQEATFKIATQRVGGGIVA